jgi:6-phosphofructokinase 1
LNSLVTVGGEDTLGVAYRLYTQDGYPIVGVPKTIDNDLAGTDYTFGFDTAIQIVTEAIDRLHTTAESHKRVMVVEVMGRHAGWIAAHSGMAGGADCILVPEWPIVVDDVCALVRKRFDRGREFAIVVVAEGAKPAEGANFVTKTEHVDDFGHAQLGGIGDWLGQQIERKMGIDTRVTVLGHVQRGGTPTAYDRVLATRFGLKAVDLIRERQFGHMAALRGTEIVSVPIEDALHQKLLNPKVFNDASVFFG